VVLLLTSGFGITRSAIPRWLIWWVPAAAGQLRQPASCPCQTLGSADPPPPPCPNLQGLLHLPLLLGHACPGDQ
jgi:hypothetical protein